MGTNKNIVKKFEDFEPMNPGNGIRGIHTTVNNHDLDHNLTLDPESHIYKNKMGLKPYLKKQFGVEPIKDEKSIPIYGVHYMSETDANVINALGDEIKLKVEQFKSMVEDFTKNNPSKKSY